MLLFRTFRYARRPPRSVAAAALLALLAAALVAGAVAGWRDHRPATAPSVRGAAAVARAVPVAPAAAPTAAAPAGPASGTGPSFSGSWLAGHPAPDLGVRAQSAILVDVGARRQLWARDPVSERAPASLTKLLTAMVALDLAPLDRVVTVAPWADVKAVRAVEPASTVMEPGLTSGERLTEGELLYGLFLRSGNDAAEALAAGLVPRERFIALMNAKAAELKMEQSHFTTPVGLDAPGMYTTAYDLAIAAATIETRYPKLARIAATPEHDIGQTATHKAFRLRTYNRMLLPGSPAYYQDVDGLKTAFTFDAGPCAIITARRGGRRLVAVILHSPNFFADARALLDYGFAQPAQRPSGRGARP